MSIFTIYNSILCIYRVIHFNHRRQISLKLSETRKKDLNVSFRVLRGKKKGKNCDISSIVGGAAFKKK